MPVLLICVGALFGARTDLAERRIPNWLSAGLFVLGVAWSTVWGKGLLPSLESCLLVGLFFGVFAGLKHLAWGDVKFAAALAAFGGPWFGVWIILFTSAFGLFLGLETLIRLKRKRVPQSGGMPYGVALAAGAVTAVIFLPGLWS